MELLLVREGFSLTDLRGYEATHTVVEEREDIAASLGRLTPRTVRLAIAGAVALGLLAGVETGHATPVVASILVALALHAIGELDEPGPVTKTHKVDRHGLTEREITDYLTMSNTLHKMEEEEREEARKRAEQKAKKRQ